MRGRKAPGPEFVQRLAGSADSKERLEVILLTLTGRLGVSAAAGRLGITPQRVHELRQQALQAALDALAARPLGRPRQQRTADQEHIDALQHEIEGLRHQLQGSQLREQIAVLLSGRHERGEKKRGGAAGRPQRASR